MTLFLAYQNRGITKTITVTDSSGNTIVPGVNDKVRAIIGHEGRLGTNNADAKLVVESGTPTAAGSSFTKDTTNGVNTLRLDATDLAFDPGVYTLFIDLFDNADAAEYKNVDRQVFVLEPT